jgi:hypothetical protein
MPAMSAYLGDQSIWLFSIGQFSPILGSVSPQRQVRPDLRAIDTVWRGYAGGVLRNAGMFLRSCECDAMHRFARVSELLTFFG